MGRKRAAQKKRDTEKEKRLKRQEKAALAFANKIRKENGLSPLRQMPSGDRDDSASCPIATALEDLRSEDDYGDDAVSVVPGRVRVRVEKTYTEMPSEVKQFITDFDDGLYPELDNDPEDTCDDCYQTIDMCECECTCGCMDEDDDDF